MTGAGDEPTAPVIRYDNDALTVHLVNVPVAQILEEISRQSGASVRGQVREPHELTASFDSVRLPEALGRLLGDQNFALVYGKGGRLRAVRLLGGAQVALAAPVPPPLTASPTGTESSFPGSLSELIDHQPPIPVSGRLAEVLGSESATLRQLVELSLHHDDPAVRSEAVRTGIAAFEAEPLRSAVISELKNTDGAFLTGLLRSADHQPEELAMQVLREALTPEFRVKASSVLQRLRAGS